MTGFWSTALLRGVTADLAEKYAWLGAAVLDAPPPTSISALREAARRWPGSLRECQRTHPAVYRARQVAVAARARERERSYDAWRTEGHAAVCLWAELHALHADVLRWRAIAPPGLRNDIPKMLRNLTMNDPRRRAKWPAVELVIGWGRTRVGAALAHLCLGHRAGLDRAELDRALFAVDDPNGSPD